MDSTYTVLCSIFLAFLAVIIFRKSNIGCHIKIPVATLTLTLLVCSGIYIVSDRFTGAGIDESVIFHLRYGLSGAGFFEYAGLIIFFIALLAVSILSFFIIYLSR